MTKAEVAVIAKFVAQGYGALSIRDFRIVGMDPWHQHNHGEPAFRDRIAVMLASLSDRLDQ